ncbi:MAG: winged helix-turn-helix transcriptional regulator [Candidatus Binatia bacterium]
MRWNDIGDITCSVARTLSVVGDRWTLLILRDAFLRTRRFEDFQARLGMTRHRLADRLAKLVEHGVFDRVRYQERPERYEYHLTQKGRDLYPVIVALVGWGDRWMAGTAGPPIELVHRSCGQVMMPTMTCPHCGDALTARDITAQPGPALRARTRRPKRRGTPARRAAQQRSVR